MAGFIFDRQFFLTELAFKKVVQENTANLMVRGRRQSQAGWGWGSVFSACVSLRNGCRCLLD
jgi:hypothetical protein